MATPASSRLGPAQRAAALDRMAGERFDVVVIGGGATGMGAALDAATRGLAVALIEQRDIASGTSSRSSKLIHGGLRYLEHLNVKLVREALRERGRLLSDLAPHLVHPVPFLYPFTHRIWERAYVGSGVALYDLLAASGSRPLPRHRHLSRRSLLAAFPDLDPRRFTGGIRYFDASTDDARFTMFLARTAARYGTALATSTRATGFRTAGRRVDAVEAVDLETGTSLAIRGRVVINATGVWTDDVEHLVGDTVRNITASKGIHLMVPRDRIDGAAGLITKTPTSVLFVIPLGAYWVIGTTDTPWDLDKAHPAASRRDIDYLLGQTNALLANPIDREDVVGVFAGLRPLVTGDAVSTAKLSREHAVTRPAPGLVSIAGGKFTTYRVMAEDVVNEAVDDFGTLPPTSATATIPLVGADGYQQRWDQRAALSRSTGLDVGQIERLLRRYGSAVDDLFASIAADPDLGRPLPGAAHYLGAEVRYAATHEGALHLDDILTRRTRISIEAPDRGLDAAAAVIELVAGELHWDRAAQTRELEHYRARVSAEVESQAMPDDMTADAARLGAPDVRMAGR